MGRKSRIAEKSALRRKRREQRDLSYSFFRLERRSRERERLSSDNELRSVVERPGNDVELLFARQLDEVHGVPGNAHRELRILFGVIHRVEQRFAVEDIDVDVVRALVRIRGEVTVEQARKLGLALREILAQRAGHHRERVGDSVERIVVRQLRDGHHGRHGALPVAPVHRVRTGSERRARAAAVRRVSGLLPVDHVGRDREHGLRRKRTAIRRTLADLFHEAGNERDGDVVHARIVVPVAGKFALGLEINDEPVRIADRLHLRVLDCGKRVRRDGKPRDPAGHRAQNLHVVKRHLDALVAVFVVHVVNAVERVDVGLGEPVLHLVEAFGDLVVVEHVLFVNRRRGSDLFPGNFVAAAVERAEERLGKIRARAEELHLLADAHRGDAARDPVVVAPVRPHQIVVLILDGRGLDGHAGTELLEVLRKILRPEHREIGLGSRAEIVERVQHPERVLRHERPPVLAHAADGFRHPGRIAGEQRVVFRRTDEADDAQLHHELVDDFLQLLLRDRSRLEVAFEIDVEEGRNAPERHRRAVLLLDRGEIAEIRPLHGLAGIARGTPELAAVAFSHRLQLFERADLLRHLLAQTDDVLDERVRTVFVMLPAAFGDEEINPVERDAAVVADDAPAPVGVGKPGDDVRRTRPADVARIDVEHAFVVRLAVLFENLLRFRIQRETVAFERLLRHAQPAVGHQRALERRVRLQPDDDLQLLVDVAGRMRSDRGDDGLVRVEHALLRLLSDERGKFFPKTRGLFGNAAKERVVPFVGRVVFLDEVARVHAFRPIAGNKSAPRGLQLILNLVGFCRHGLNLGVFFI